MSNQKWFSLSTSVTLEQKQAIEQKAESSGMTVNEYIKARLFIDEAEEINKISNLDKWMIKVMSYISVHINAISQKTLLPDKYQNLEQEAIDVIKRSGFLKEYEILKEKNQQQD
jgi:hypothetical protein